MQSVRPADKRSSNLELLRIMMMILIVAHHYAHHGGFRFPDEIISLNRLWIQLITIGGKLGVDVFVLISGYFLIHSTGHKTARTVRIWFRLLTYSLIPFCLLAAFGQIRFTPERLIHSLLPISYDCWWFASAYFVLYLFIPFINRFLHSMNKKEYQRYLLVLLTIWCVIPTLLHVEMQRNNLLWFFCLYSMIGYYRLHHHAARHRGSTCILLAAAILLAVYASAIVLDLIGRNHPFAAEHALFFYDYYSIPIVIAALLLVIGFSRIRMKQSRLINTVSAAMFGVYLIHDNPYIRKLLWDKIFRNASFAESRMLIPHSIAAVLVTFAACTAIELIRIRVLEKPCERLYLFIAGKADRLADRILSYGRLNGGQTPEARTEEPEDTHWEGQTNEHQD